MIHLCFSKSEKEEKDRKHPLPEFASIQGMFHGLLGSQTAL